MPRHPSLRVALPAAAALVVVPFVVTSCTEPPLAQTRTVVIGYASDTAQQLFPGAAAKVGTDFFQACSTVDALDGPRFSEYSLVLVNDRSAAQRFEHIVKPGLVAAGWRQTSSGNHSTGFSKDDYHLSVTIWDHEVVVYGSGPCVDKPDDMKGYVYPPATTPTNDFPVPATPPGAPLTPAPGTSTHP